jgi:hypothetical protein
MGYTVLYIAFGVVALWLLGEVLLQYKARLRWRLLAFAGFLGVVFGVHLASVVVIGAGAVAFAAGQTFVTLSYRKGFAEGWAIRGRPTAEADSGSSSAGGGGGSRRRRKGSARGDEAAAASYDSYDEQQSVPADEPLETPAEQTAVYGGFDSTQIYQPMPMHDESGEVPLYDGQSTYTPDPYTSGGYEGYGAQGYGNDWSAQQQPATAAYAQDPQQQQQYAAAWDTSQQTYGYDPANGGYADPYAQTPQYGYDTPAGGVWVPQQPTGDPDPSQQSYIPPQQQPHPDQPQYADPYDPYRF